MSQGRLTGLVTTALQEAGQRNAQPSISDEAWMEAGGAADDPFWSLFGDDGPAPSTIAESSEARDDDGTPTPSSPTPASTPPPPAAAASTAPATSEAQPSIIDIIRRGAELTFSQVDSQPTPSPPSPSTQRLAVQQLLSSAATIDSAAPADREALMGVARQYMRTIAPNLSAMVDASEAERAAASPAATAAAAEVAQAESLVQIQEMLTQSEVARAAVIEATSRAPSTRLVSMLQSMAAAAAPGQSQAAGGSLLRQLEATVRDAHASGGPLTEEEGDAMVQQYAMMRRQQNEQHDVSGTESPLTVSPSPSPLIRDISDDGDGWDSVAREQDMLRADEPYVANARNVLSPLPVRVDASSDDGDDGSMLSYGSSPQIRLSPQPAESPVQHHSTTASYTSVSRFMLDDGNVPSAPPPGTFATPLNPYLTADVDEGEYKQQTAVHATRGTARLDPFTDSEEEEQFCYQQDMERTNYRPPPPPDYLDMHVTEALHSINLDMDDMHIDLVPEQNLLDNVDGSGYIPQPGSLHYRPPELDEQNSYASSYRSDASGSSSPS